MNAPQTVMVAVTQYREIAQEENAAKTLGEITTTGDDEKKGIEEAG